MTKCEIKQLGDMILVVFVVVVLMMVVMVVIVKLLAVPKMVLKMVWCNSDVRVVVVIVVTQKWLQWK